LLRARSVLCRDLKIVRGIRPQCDAREHLTGVWRTSLSSNSLVLDPRIV